MQRLSLLKSEKLMKHYYKLIMLKNWMTLALRAFSKILKNSLIKLLILSSLTKRINKSKIKNKLKTQTEAKNNLENFTVNQAAIKVSTVSKLNSLLKRFIKKMVSY